MTRRHAAAAIGAAGLLLLAGCGEGGGKWHALDVSGSSLPLHFAMTRASDGKPVTEADFRGRIVMLYFGYTFCPDICPTTLSNIAGAIGRLGPAARDVRVLFVTVDPDRDTPSVLADYVGNFGPQFVGLRGTDDQLAALARRYHLGYSVTPKTADHPYEVTHSSAVYVFDRSGAARLLNTSLASAQPDVAGVAADLKRLVGEGRQTGWLARLRRML
jgi:protein SCO1/2